ncbi:MAG: phenylalanine--tRNA ligase subunit beta, partial [Hydrogenophilales bacterium CG03_land_8_20_14_0_80_62_28]
AGIMGGATSAVSTASTDIFLEAAHFTPAAMAGRARSYSLSTDSSHRFERGVDPLLPPPAMERATQLILAICGGQAGPVSKVGGAPAQAVAIAFRPERARRLLGMAISDAEMNAIFDHLGLAVVRQGETWQVSAPSYRFDLAVEVDLIEEIARIKGYDNIPATRPKAAAAMHPRPEQQRGADEFKTRLMALGYQEVVTYSFIDPRQQRMAMPDAEPIALVNPIASQMGVMRGSLIPGLLQTLSYNLNRGQERLRIFELGRCFLSTEHGAQPIRLGGLAYGSAHPEQWGEPTRANDFYDLKADLDALLWPTVAHYEPGEHAALHPGQTARLILDGQTIGWLGALHPKWATELNLNRPAILFELDWANLAARPLPRYRGVSRFPAVRRDIAILVDSGHSVGQILDTVYANIPRLVTDFVLFDVYQGQGVPTDKKSLAFKMLLQDTEKTLTDSEIEGAVAAVLNLLAARFGAVLRA